MLFFCRQYGDVASNSLSIVVYFPNEANGGFIAQEIFNNSTTISNHRPIPVIYHQPVIASSTTQATHTNSRDDILLSSTIEHVLNSTIDRIFGEIVASSTERVAVVPQTSDSEAEATTLDSENEVVEFTTKITNRFEEESEIHPTCLASLCG